MKFQCASICVYTMNASQGSLPLTTLNSYPRQLLASLLISLLILLHPLDFKEKIEGVIRIGD